GVPPVEPEDGQLRVGGGYHRWNGSRADLGFIADGVDVPQGLEEGQGGGRLLRPPEPAPVAELDGDGRLGKQLPDPAEVIEALPAAGEPGRELEVEGPELARLLEGLDRLAEEGEGLHEGRLRRAGPVVEGHGAVGLDVEDKIGGCHPGPL